MKSDVGRKYSQKPLPKRMPERLEGWLLVPRELLHVAAYRLIGKRYRYTLAIRT